MKHLLQKLQVRSLQQHISESPHSLMNYRDVPNQFTVSYLNNTNPEDLEQVLQTAVQFFSRTMIPNNAIDKYFCELTYFIQNTTFRHVTMKLISKLVNSVEYYCFHPGFPEFLSKYLLQSLNCHSEQKTYGQLKMLIDIMNVAYNHVSYYNEYDAVLLQILDLLSRKYISSSLKQYLITPVLKMCYRTAIQPKYLLGLLNSQNIDDVYEIISIQLDMNEQLIQNYGESVDLCDLNETKVLMLLIVDYNFKPTEEQCEFIEERLCSLVVAEEAKETLRAIVNLVQQQ